MSIIPEHQGPGRPCGRPPTAIQCALAVVTAGLAVAAAMLALIGSAGTAQARYLAAVSEAAPSPQPSSSSELQAEAAPQRQGSVFAGLQPQAGPQRQGSVFSQFQPQAGPYRQGSVFSEFHPQPEPTFTPFPQLSLPAGGMSPLSFMPMPVDGTWQVTCGYRCGLHTPANNATFALDIVPVEEEAAGQPVRSPVDGQIIAVIDSATYFCGDQWNHGREGGSAIVIDLQNPSGAPCGSASSISTPLPSQTTSAPTARPCRWRRAPSWATSPRWTAAATSTWASPAWKRPARYPNRWSSKARFWKTVTAKTAGRAPSSLRRALEPKERCQRPT